ncbi:hypothetical protein LSO9J_410001 [Candidatus Liberibacter solanacearum]
MYYFTISSWSIFIANYYPKDTVKSMVYIQIVIMGTQPPRHGGFGGFGMYHRYNNTKCSPLR